jgi:hypothetical protein
MTDQVLSRGRFWIVAIGLAVVMGGSVSATSVIPIADAELYRRADLVVRGVVLSSDTVSAEDGWPETITVIRPIRAWKGALSENLVLHQAGGVLPDGRFFKLWGRPDYGVGDEVIVFAIRRPEGDFQTAEMLLGKFAVSSDDAGRLFAVPELTIGEHPGVVVHVPPGMPERIPSSDSRPPVSSLSPAANWEDAPRELSGQAPWAKALPAQRRSDT